MPILSAPVSPSRIRELAATGPIAVGSRANISTIATSVLQQNSGGNPRVTYCSAHRIACDAYGMRLVWSNRGIAAGVEKTTDLGAWTLKATLAQGTALVPVTFFGMAQCGYTVSADGRSVTVPVGGEVEADVLPVFSTAGEWVRVRSYYDARLESNGGPSGGNNRVVITQTGGSTALGEGYAVGDQTDTASPTFLQTGAICAPTAVIAVPASPRASVALMGSSSTHGQGDTQEAPNYDSGYLSRAMSAGGVPCLRLGAPADTILLMQAGWRYRREMLLRAKPAFVIQQNGISDVYNGANLATVQARHMWLWDQLRGLGCKVIQTTYTVRNTSTDNWATLANQTVHSTDVVRQQVNDWINTMPHPALVGVWDIAPAVEDPGSPGKWRVDGSANKWTADGTHLSPYGHQQLAAFLQPLVATLTL